MAKLCEWTETFSFESGVLNRFVYRLIPDVSLIDFPLRQVRLELMSSFAQKLLACFKIQTAFF